MSAYELGFAFLASLVVGVVSAIMGLGGGLFLVPLLTLVPSISLEAARGTSLICTLATSAAGSIALDKARLADFDLVLTLEIAAAIGALVGAELLAPHLDPAVVFGGFALLVGLAAYRMARGEAKPTAPQVPADELATAEPAPEERQEPALEPASAEPAPAPIRLGWGALGFVLAGIASAVLGIGGAPIKVPVQTEICRVPLRTALANTNIMVGITAAVGSAVYFGRGSLALALVAPCALGISVGAYLGGTIAPKLPVRRLRGAFTLILVLVAARMLWKAIASAR